MKLTAFKELELFYHSNAGAFTVGSIAISVFSAYQNHQDLGEIRRRLDEINKKLDVVIEQNRRVLARIDKLRVEIRKDVKDIVDFSELDQRHTQLGTMETMILDFGKKNKYNPESALYDNMLTAVDYVLEYERRLEKFPLLINEFELLRYVSDGDKNVDEHILEKITWKHNQLVATAKKIESELNHDWSNLKDFLSKEEYVKSSNIYTGIDIDKLSYSMRPDLPTSETKSVKKTTPQLGGDGGDEYYVNETITLHKNIDFNQNKQELKRKIEERIKICIRVQEDYTRFSSAITMFKKYHSLVKGT